MRSKLLRLSLLPVALLLLIGAECPTPPDDDDDSSGDDDDDSVGDDDDDDDSVGDDDDSAEPNSVTISGTLTVYPYYEDAAGVRQSCIDPFDSARCGLLPDGRPVRWENIYGSFPYGSGMIIAVEDPSSNWDAPFGAVTLHNIDPHSQSFSIEVETELEEIYLRGAIDGRNPDRFIGPGDLNRTTINPISTIDGDVSGVRIEIDVNVGSCILDDCCDTCGGGTGCASSGGSSTLSGTTFMPDRYIYTGGEVALAAYSPSRRGPYGRAFLGEFPPVVAGDPREMPFELNQCVGAERELLSIWDLNQNRLFDPLDAWGARVEELDVPTGPFTIPQTDLEDLLVQVPLNLIQAPFPIPYVAISGVIRPSEHYAFADLPEDTRVYLTVDKEPRADRPRAFDIDWEESATYSMLVDWVDIQSAEEHPFLVYAPANTITRLGVSFDVGDDDELDYIAPRGTVGNPNAGFLEVTDENLEDVVVEVWPWDELAGR